MSNVLVVGGGGREHALVWGIARGREVKKVYVAPGNAGTAIEVKARNLGFNGAKKENFEKLYEVIKQEGIDMVVVGPEAPLVDGVVDFLNAKGYGRVFGPTKAAAKLESDKYFSYDLMNKLGIPQAFSIKCTSLDAAANAIKEIPGEGVVLKTRGLAAGKGVLVCDTKEQALEKLVEHIGAYGNEQLIAEKLGGQEFSAFGISDGERVIPLKISIQDHKPQLDGDKGPNTGGMGAYCPSPIADEGVVNWVSENVMNPVVREMKEMGSPYKGFFYAGMMMTEQGPKVIEFNIRFGDPEAQPAVMMLEDSLYEPLASALDGKLDQIDMRFKKGAAVCVVLASKGYPGKYIKGLPLSGIEEANRLHGVKIFHAGTATEGEHIVNSGGRVLGVTAYSPDGTAFAKNKAYDAASLIDIPGGWQLRTDIADKALR